MIKLRATRKEMRGSYSRILSLGYCEAQYLLAYESPIAYSAGTYGWACDYYDINGILISTGYRPLASKGTAISYDRIRDYEIRARTIRSEASHDEACVQIRALLEALVAEAVEGAPR